MELKRYVDLGSLTADGLWDLLREPESKRSEGVGQVDMDRFDQAVDQVKKSNKQGPHIDQDYGAKLSKTLANVLGKLDHQWLSDPGFWTWLAINRYRELVVLRWHADLLEGFTDSVDAVINRMITDPGIELEKPDPKHFSLHASSKGSLNAYSRHALSRYFWAGEVFDDDQDLKNLWSNQDFRVQLFERECVTHKPVAVAVMRWYRAEEPNQEEVRDRLENLNQRLALYAVETLNADDVHRILIT